ncbi:MAG: MFS transporter [Pseudomonadota bacterium]
MIEAAVAADAPATGPASARTLPALTQSKPARFATIMVLYFLQGVPFGLTTVALTAWLSAQGATPVEIGAFVGFALLPWSTKLFNGLLMDRFTFKPMGRRRSWILSAQFLMIAALLAMAFLAPTANDIMTLSALCFALNLCATFNDVAVDGMAVDIVPSDERTAINSVMFASQFAGIAATSAIAGSLLMAGDVRVTALVLAGIVLIATVFVSLFCERPGERLMPWSKGEASPECLKRQRSAFWPIISGVFRSLFKRHVLLLLAGMACTQSSDAFADAVAPSLGVQHLGWTSEAYSNFGAMLSLVIAGAIIVLPAPLKIWLGHRMAVIVPVVMAALTAAAAGFTFPYWQGSTEFMLAEALMGIFSWVAMIGLISWTMQICNPAIAATQFALFMAVNNFARSGYSSVSGWVVEAGGYPAAYFAVSGWCVVGLVLIWLARVGDETLVTNHDD